MSLKTRIALLTLFTALMVGIGGAAWSTNRTHDVLTAELHERGISIGAALAETLINQVLVRDAVGVLHGLRRLHKTSEDIAYIYVTDFDGSVFGHTFEGGFPNDLPKQGQTELSDNETVSRHLSYRDRQILEVAYPLIRGMGAKVTIGLDTAFAHDQIRQTGLLILGVSVGIGILVSLFGMYLGSRLLAPISRLVAQMQRYGRGETITVDDITGLGGSKETRALSHGFLDMIRVRRENETELNQVKDTLDNTLDAVLMFHPDSLQFFYANRGAAEQLGYTRHELLEMTALDIQRDFEESDFRELIGLLLSGEHNTMTVETLHYRKDRSSLPVEVFLQYIPSEPPRILGIARDISERKRNEAALQELNRELEKRVAARTAELASANAQLQDTLDTLQAAQDELVRSEKLASLGSLVAGVAHELNTPLGNSVTIGTTLQEWLRDFHKEVEAGTLRRSSLNGFLAQAEEATGLLIRNLARGAELISDFKQVAVDQTSAQRRDFDLRRVVIEIVETLQPQFKTSPHRIELDIPEDIHLDSYPGPLGQVITNLALNALLHAFSVDEPGLLTITARPLPDEQVELLVSDNGCGIPAEHLSRIFDPFFTTKLGKGGSGLGMHIVYTLVTRVLGGSIAVDSPDEGGTRLTMRLPLTAPEQTVENDLAG